MPTIITASGTECVVEERLKSLGVSKCRTLVSKASNVHAGGFHVARSVESFIGKPTPSRGDYLNNMGERGLSSYGATGPLVVSKGTMRIRSTGLGVSKKRVPPIRRQRWAGQPPSHQSLVAAIKDGRRHRIPRSPTPAINAIKCPAPRAQLARSGLKN
ncbi:hypothetical protein DFH09DRAFT_1087096 [Mycena vulgaris]|nr:hypothetical protein DFH09DRAFT_1087096 [Mycena vulgaris]